MKLPIYQVDAFAENIFQGNSAAICPLEGWLSDEILQNIALENNLSETAFFIKKENQYHIRWFTPRVEVDLCGHATLACAYVMFEILEIERCEIMFHSKSGQLTVTRNGELITLDFPKSTLSKCEISPEITKALGKEPLEVWKADDYMAIYESEAEILSLSPDFDSLRQIECRGIIATSRGKNADFVSRFFAPRYGIDEDPVTGSAHCELMPYWARVFGKNKLSAAQVSQRGGWLECELVGERVHISGRAVKYLEGTIEI